MIAVIGAFDGFHSGHRALLSEAARIACRNKTSWAVITFTPHPGVFFDTHKKLLFSSYEKCAEAKLLSIPEVIKLRFEQIYDMGPEDFLEMLTEKYAVSGIVVGEGFRFGRGAGGDCAFIRKFCDENEYSCSIVETVKHGGADNPEAGNKISARVLREYYRNGKVDILRDALKFPCPISGIVVHGDGRGAKLGFPTVNISVPPEKMLPADGVYAVSVLAEGVWRAGAMFVGRPPMFSEVEEARAEVHISDFSGNLYDKRVTVFLEEFVRPPAMFGDEAELARDVKLCAERAVRIFRKRRESEDALYGDLLNVF